MSTQERDLIEELNYARSKGLITIEYWQQRHERHSIKVFFAPHIKEKARIKFAEYLSSKYIVYDMYFDCNRMSFSFSYDRNNLLQQPSRVP